MNQLRHFLALWLATFFSLAASAHDFTVDGVYYQILSEWEEYYEENSVKVANRNDESDSYVGSVTIPAQVEYNGVTYKVVGINDRAFDNCERLKSVDMPSTVRFIGWAAFNNTPSMLSVKLPDGLEKLGDRAFDGSGLETITWNDKLKEMCSSCFSNCRSLPSNFTIPVSVEKVGSDIFRGSSIRSLVIPEGSQLKDINNSVFNGMDNLSYIVNESSLDIASLCNVDVPIFTSIVQQGDFWFAKDGATNILCTYSGNATELVLPANYEGGTYKIGKNVFRSGKFTSVTIGDGVTEIGDDAFRDCNKIETLSIGKSVKRIGARAFQSANESLKEIVIPTSVTELGEYAFYDCNRLASVTLGEGLVTIGDYAFSNCHDLNKITIPNSTKTVGSDFVASTPINEITLGTGLESIDMFAFRNVWNTPVIYNYSSIDIEKDCRFKDGIVVYNNITNKSGFMFGTQNGVLNLIKYTGTNANVTLPDDFDGKSYIVGRGAFRDSNIETVVFGNNVTELGVEAFNNCRSLTSVTLNDKLLKIGSNAFNGCEKLQSLDIPNSVTTLDNNSMSCCGIRALTVGTGLTTVGSNAFESVWYLEYIYNYSNIDLSAYTDRTVYDKPVAKGDFMFARLDGKEYLIKYTGSATDLVLPDDVDGQGYYIGAYVFQNNKKLKSVTFGKKVLGIGESAFRDLNELRKLTLNEGLTVIGREAFNDCDKLESFVVPNTVTRIEDRAFSNCYYGPKNIVIGNSVEYIGYEAFGWCYALESLNIPNSVTTLGDRFISCTNVNTLIVGSGITAISEKTFEEANNLRSVYNLSDIDLTSYVNDECTVYSDVAFDGDYLFAKKDDAYMLVMYLGSDTEIVLPENIKNESYVVAENFMKDNAITSLDTGNGVTAIGNNAFRECKQLTSVVIGDAVESIGNEVFYGCEELKTVTIGKALKSRNGGTFDNCNNIATVNYNAVDFRGNFDFHRVSTLNFGNEVKRIPEDTFNNNPNLTSVVIPASVDTIFDNTFRNCENLEEINIPDGVKHLGYEAFAYNGKLKEVAIGKGLVSCGWRPFNESNAIKTVKFNAIDLNSELRFDNDVTIILGNDVQRIPKYMFCDNQNITELNIPESVKYISDNAFRNCSNLTNIVIPDNVEVIGECAFADIAIKKLTLSAALDTIGNNAFDRHELTELVIPDGVRYIGNSAFRSEWDRRTLEFLTLGQSVETIGNEAFHCSAVKNLTIPNSVKTIGSYAFSNNEKLENLTLGNYLEEIGEYAFSNNNHLKELVIPNSVTIINKGAFESCNSMQKLVFSNNLREIGARVFHNCYSLKELVFPDALRVIGENAFSYLWSLDNIRLNEGLVSIGKEAFLESRCGDIITIPSTVTEIGSKAFGESRYCMVKSTTPPALGAEVFSNTKMMVIVPHGTWDAYSSDNHWQEYSIMEQGKDIVLKRDEANGIYTFYDAALKLGVSGHEYGTLKVVDLPIEKRDFETINTNYITLMELDLSEAEVDEIPEGAFQNMVLLNKVVLPNSLTRIGRDAFRGCVSIANELILPEYLEYIGDCAFYNCFSIPSLKLNDYLLNIGSSAFYNCSGLTGDFVAPRSLENIFSGAFSQCSNITGIDLSQAENLASLGSEAFDNCSKATYIKLPDHLMDIEWATFRGCRSVESVTFPTYIEAINGEAFSNNSSLKLVNLKGTNLRTIGENAFRECSNLLAVNLQETNLNNIGSNAFENCSSMKTVNLPDNYCNLHTLGTRAFAYCRSLENITSPGMSPAQCFGADQTNSPFLGVSANKTSFTIPDNDDAYEAYLMANFWGAFISKATHQELINESLNGSDKGNVYFRTDDIYSIKDARARARRRAPGVDVLDTDVMAQLSDTTRLFIPTGKTVSFVIKPEKGYTIGSVLFNGEDVTDQVVDNVFTTPAVNAGGSMQVSFVEAEHIPATAIQLNKSALALPIGATEQLTATLTPAGATDNDVIWKSSDTKVATVDADGNVTALSEGTATITATAEGGKLAGMCSVTVTKDNFFAVTEDIETEILSSVDVEVGIVNKNDIYGFQCDIYLPEGVTLDRDAIAYSDELGALPLIYGTSDDGKALRIMRYSDSDKPVKANAQQRVAFTLPLTIGNIAGGNMQVKIANIRFASESNGIKKYIAPDITTVLAVNGYAMGDVNQDNTIDVADVVAIGYRTVNKPITTTFNERLADLNSDGEIDITDLALEVRLVLAGTGRATAKTKSRTMDEQTNDRFSLSIANSNVTFALDTDESYTAYQCDIVLPDGIELVKDARGNAVVTLDESLGATHRVVSHMADGVLKVAVFSDNNTLIPTTTAPLMHVAVKKHGTTGDAATISVTNVLFAKLLGETVTRVAGADATLAAGNATGIDSVDADAIADGIYDLQGRRAAKAVKGVYIINGKKVIK